MTDQMLDRIRHLVDLDMNTLRRVYAGFGTYDIPSQAEADRYCAGMTRGDLVSGILGRESDD